MTSNKKFVTILLFVASLSLSVLALIMGLRVLETSSLTTILYYTQIAANLNFLSGILSFGVIIALVSDME